MIGFTDSFVLVMMAVMAVSCRGCLLICIFSFHVHPSQSRSHLGWRVALCTLLCVIVFCRNLRER